MDRSLHPVQPGTVVAQSFQILLQQFSIADHHPGQAALLHRDLQIPGRGGLLVGIGQDGQLAVGLQNGVFDLADIRIAFDAQLLQQLVHREAGFGHLPLDQGAVLDHHAGPAAQQRPERDALHGEHRQNHGHRQQGEDGHYPGEQWDAVVLHGHRGQVGNDEGQHQLGGLQLSHLPLAHQSHPRDDEDV